MDKLKFKCDECGVADVDDEDDVCEDCFAAEDDDEGEDLNDYNGD